MLEWFALLQIAVAGTGAIACALAAALRKIPNDFTMLFVAVSALGLLIQIIMAIIAPLAGNPATGDLLEFWLYLIVAQALPVGAGIWALIERTAWSNLVLALCLVAVAVMVYRMSVIWGIW